MLVTLETPQGTDPAATRWTVVEQDGEPCLAGRATTTSFSLSFAAVDVVDIGQAQAAVEDIVPSLSEDEFSLVEDAANEPESLEEESALAGWSRVWQEGDFGGARVDTIRYGSPEHARDALVDVVSSALGDLVETFEVDGVNGPVGLRCQASAWLWIQPLARGPYVDQVSVLAGDTAIFVGASAVSTWDGRDLARELTRSAVDQANVG